MQEDNLDSAPKRVRDMFLKAKSAMERGQLDYAIQMFGEVVATAPTFTQARRHLRGIQARRAIDRRGNMIDMGSFRAMGPTGRVKKFIKKDPAEALKAAEELMDIDPTSLQYIYTYCDAAEAAGLGDAAAEELEIARTHHPEDIKLLYRLGDLLLSLKRTREARTVFEEVIRLLPNDQVALKRFKDAAATDTMNTGGWEQARDYRDVIKDSDGAKKLEQLSKAKMSESDVDDLIADTSERMAKDPRNLNLYRHLADLYNQAGRFEDARDILTRANDMTRGADPNIERALNDTYLKMYDYNISVLTHDGDAAGAEAVRAERDAFVFEIAAERVTKYPNDLGFKFEYGLELLKRNDFTGAIQQFQQAQKHPQHRLDAVYNLGRCFRAKGNLDIAADTLRSLLTELPVMDATKIDVLYELGNILEALGQKPEALKVYKEIYAYDIGYKDIESKVNEAL